MFQPNFDQLDLNEESFASIRFNEFGENGSDFEVSENQTFTCVYNFEISNPQCMKSNETAVHYVNDISGQLTQVLQTLDENGNVIQSFMYGANRAAAFVKFVKTIQKYP